MAVPEEVKEFNKQVCSDFPVFLYVFTCISLLIVSIKNIFRRSFRLAFISYLAQGGIVTAAGLSLFALFHYTNVDTLTRSDSFVHGTEGRCYMVLTFCALQYSFVLLFVCCLMFVFCVQLNSILETSLPISRAKMTAITKAAINARMVRK